MSALQSALLSAPGGARESAFGSAPPLGPEVARTLAMGVARASALESALMSGPGGALESAPGGARASALGAARASAPEPARPSALGAARSSALVVARASVPELALMSAPGGARASVPGPARGSEQGAGHPLRHTKCPGTIRNSIERFRTNRRYHRNCGNRSKSPRKVGSHRVVEHNCPPPRPDQCERAAPSLVEARSNNV